MSQRRKSVLQRRSAIPGVKTALALTAVFALSAALLGGFLLRSIDRQGEWQKRAAGLEQELAAAREALEQGSADIEAGRRAQSAAELAQQELESVLAELERSSSLSSAFEQRCATLSDENKALRETVMRLRQRAEADGTEIARLGELLTKTEEELAGTDVLYKEASQRLSAALRRGEQSEAELDLAQKRLTDVEEDYAGASALLSESEEAIRRARQTALSYYHSAQNARKASEAADQTQRP